MIKTAWQYHWRRLLIDNYVYVLGFLIISLLFNLFNSKLVINFNFFSAHQAIITVLFVSWVQIILLTENNTTFFLQVGISRRRNWSVQWLSLILNTLLIILTITSYLCLTTQGQSTISSFGHSFQDYQMAFAHDWQFKVFLLVLFINFVLISFLFAFIIGLLMTRINGFIVFIIVYGGTLGLFSFIAGSIGLLYHFSNATTQRQIVTGLLRLIGYSDTTMHIWPLLLTLLVVIAILSGITYLLMQNIQSKIKNR